MVNESSSIAFIVAVMVLWIGGSCMVYFAIKHGLKKKQKAEVPFYQFPFYKKIFFLGLGEKSITILSFFINILFLILLGTAIWNLMDINIITSYIIRIGGLVFLIFILIRQFLVYKKI